MKVLTNLIFAALLLVGSNVCFSQEISVRGGLNLSQMLEKLDGRVITDDPKLNPGYQIGSVIDLPINKLFSIETGFIYSTKGLKRVGEPRSDMRYEWRMNIAYLDIPIVAKVSFPIKKVTIFGYGGGYIAQGLYGDIIDKEDIDASFGTWQKVIWGNTGEALNRLDYGLNLGVGVKHRDVQYGISYEMGLANLAASDVPEAKICNRVATIYLSYALWKNKTLN